MLRYTLMKRSVKTGKWGKWERGKMLLLDGDFSEMTLHACKDWRKGDGVEMGRRNQCGKVSASGSRFEHHALTCVLERYGI